MLFSLIVTQSGFDKNSLKHELKRKSLLTSKCKANINFMLTSYTNERQTINRNFWQGICFLVNVEILYV